MFPLHSNRGPRNEKLSATQSDIFAVFIVFIVFVGSQLLLALLKFNYVVFVNAFVKTDGSED